jgi:uncharacterized protein YndB with AHSA1/START domain
MSTQAADLVVRKSLTVAAPLERAFEVFTERIGTWWPFDTHSIGGQRTRDAVFEGREGGGVYEVIEGGETAPWATVLAWEPPTRVLLSWHVNPEVPATEVEVRFASEGDGTRVVLEHRGWKRLGDKADAARGGYDAGWDYVLGRFAESAGGGTLRVLG